MRYRDKSIGNFRKLSKLPLTSKRRRRLLYDDATVMTMLMTWISPLRSIAVCVLALALGPLPVQAQRAGGGRPAPGDRTMRRQDRRDAKRDIRREMKGKPAEVGAPGDEARRRPPMGRGAVIGRALGLLSLTPEQRRSLRMIRARSDERMRQHGRRVLDLRREIDVSLFGPTLSMETARRKGSELATIVGERTTDRTNVELVVFETLTPGQRGEVRTLRDEQRARVREALRDRRARPEDKAMPDEPPLDDVEQDGPPSMEPPDGPPVGAGERGGDGRRSQGGQRPGGMPELLADLNVTPEQVRRLKQLRRDQAPRSREANMRFRDIQMQIDDMLLADTLDSEKIRSLATELGRADAERELTRFESEAGIREILTAEQAAAFRERRRRQWSRGRDREQPPSERAPDAQPPVESAPKARPIP